MRSILAEKSIDRQRNPADFRLYANLTYSNEARLEPHSRERKLTDQSTTSVAEKSRKATSAGTARIRANQGGMVGK
jgi:hypothetical protein